MAGNYLIPFLAMTAVAVYVTCYLGVREYSYHTGGDVQTFVIPNDRIVFTGPYADYARDNRTVAICHHEKKECFVEPLKLGYDRMKLTCTTWHPDSCKVTLEFGERLTQSTKFWLGDGWAGTFLVGIIVGLLIFLFIDVVNDKAKAAGDKKTSSKKTDEQQRLEDFFGAAFKGEKVALGLPTVLLKFDPKKGLSVRSLKTNVEAWHAKNLRMCTLPKGKDAFKKVTIPDSSRPPKFVTTMEDIVHCHFFRKNIRMEVSEDLSFCFYENGEMVVLHGPKIKYFMVTVREPFVLDFESNAGADDDPKAAVASKLKTETTETPIYPADAKPEK